tara:strand:- start:3872 stop:4180 length:309 start_codon:yes stop_codon:yes gene_type:complete
LTKHTNTYKNEPIKALPQHLCNFTGNGLKGIVASTFNGSSTRPFLFEKLTQTNPIVTQNKNILTIGMTRISPHCLDFNSSIPEIVSATNQYYTPTSNGNYTI